MKESLDQVLADIRSAIAMMRGTYMVMKTAGINHEYMAIYCQRAAQLVRAHDTLAHILGKPLLTPEECIHLTPPPKVPPAITFIVNTMDTYFRQRPSPKKLIDETPGIKWEDE